tara:strand:+ start:1245 stop:2507 length:1263 start_codon:yes stop_codon:yes gene_type:complete
MELSKRELSKRELSEREHSQKLIPISEIKKKYDRIEIATYEDGPELVEVFKNVPMKTPFFDILYDRSPNYFDLLKLQRGRPFVFILKSKSGKTQGVATFIIKEHFIESKLQKVLYVCDMRTTPDIEKETKRQWKESYTEFMSQMEFIKEFEGIRYCYGAIILNNKRAIKAFTEKNNRFVFKELGTYQALNIFGKKPKIFKKEHLEETQFTTHKASTSDLDNLWSFLEKQNRKKLFGDFISKEESEGDDDFSFRLKNWPDFSLSNFILIKDRQGEIRGCVCPWTPHTCKKFILSNMSFKLRAVASLMPLLGKVPVKNNSTLETLYLTHFEIDFDLNEDEKEQITRSLFKEIENQNLRSPYHILSLLSLPHYETLNILKDMGYLMEVSNGKVFQITHEIFKNNKEHQIPVSEHHLGLELALI